MNPPPFPAAAVDALPVAAKAYLRIESDGEDALIERLAGTALALGEAFTGTAWIAREWTDVIAAEPGWARLAVAPVGAITGVAALGDDGAAVALAAEAYAIDIDARGEGWVRAGSAEGARLRVTFDAGAAAGWGDLPPPLAQGAVLLVAHLFENRAGEAAPPAAVAALWRPWRRVRLA